MYALYKALADAAEAVTVDTSTATPAAVVAKIL